MLQGALPPFGLSVAPRFKLLIFSSIRGLKVNFFLKELREFAKKHEYD